MKSGKSLVGEQIDKAHLYGHLFDGRSDGGVAHSERQQVESRATNIDKSIAVEVVVAVVVSSCLV